MNATSAIRRLIWIVLAIVVVLTVGDTAYVWRQRQRPNIPDVPAAGLDAEVAATLADARTKVEREPKSAAAWGHYGLIAFAHDKYAECLPLFEHAEQRDPKDFRWPYFRGLALMFEHPEESVAALEHARELSPNQLTIQLRLAEILLELDRPDEAHALFLSVLKNREGDPRAQLGLGRISGRRGEWTKAVDLLKRAAASPTAQKTAHSALAEAYLRLNDPATADAERAKAEALPLDRPWPDPLLAQAEKLRTGLIPRLDQAEYLISNGMMDDAQEALRQIIRDHPESDLAQLRLAKLRIRLSKMDEAVPALQAALKINPHLAEGYFLLAGIQMLRQEFELAEGGYVRAVTEKPTYGLAHYNLGQCRLQRGNRAGAEEAFRAAVRTRSDLAATHLALGKLLLGEGKRDEAIPYLENAAKLEPANAEAKSLLERAKMK